MKLKLIAPKCNVTQATNCFPPYVLAVLAGLTPSDIQVSIQDENIEKIDYDEQVDLVGITVIVQTANNAFRIADEYRRRGITVFMGGIFPEACPEQCLEHADSVVLSEVEEIWEDILEDFKSGTYKKVYKAENRPEIKGLPLPRHDLLKNKKGYLTNNLIMTSKGCINRCEFCSAGKHWQGQVKTKDIEDIIAEIKLLDMNEPILFIDDNLIWNPEYAKSLFRSIIPLRIKWVCCGACVDSIEDIELVELAKQSGCISTLLGFETINERALKKSRKGFNKVEKYKNTIDLFHSVGIAVQGTFIFGLDEDNTESFKTTVKFIEDSELDMVTFNLLYPYPGTPFRERLKRENRLIEDKNEWENFSYKHLMFHPKNMSYEELCENFEWISKRLASKKLCAKRIYEAVLNNRAPEHVFHQNINLRKHVAAMYGGEWE